MVQRIECGRVSLQQHLCEVVQPVLVDGTQVCGKWQALVSKCMDLGHLLHLGPVLTTHLLHLGPVLTTHLLHLEPVLTTHLLHLEPVLTTHLLHLEPVLTTHLLHLEPVLTTHLVGRYLLAVWRALRCWRGQASAAQGQEPKLPRQPAVVGGCHARSARHTARFTWDVELYPRALVRLIKPLVPL
jgi:hypothetical protein